jgi:signal transduction histidine kinase
MTASSRDSSAQHEDGGASAPPPAAVAGPAGSPEPAPRERPSPIPAYIYIAVVALTAGFVLAICGPTALADWRTVLIWAAVNLAAELFWLPTVTGRATSSMASTVNYATIFILGPAPAAWAVAISVGLATAVIQRRSWLKTVFNLAQSALAAAAAGWFYVQAGGAPVDLQAVRDPALLVAFVNTGVVYFVVNTGLVAVVVGLWEGQSIAAVWRQNYGYADDLLTSLTLFLLSPLMVMGYLTLGLVGLALCVLPMLLVRNASGRYIELRGTQEAMLWNARMAAMGEMAAEIGHELGNVLQVISAQAQMLLTDADGVRGDRAKRAVRQIFERAIDMRRLAKGLQDFSHRELVRRHEHLGELVRETIEMVEPQNQFDGVVWEVDLSGDDPLMEMDGGQIRQVLVNLLRNAVEAFGERSGERRISVRTERAGDLMRIEVGDNGPGFPADLLERVFEPWFTTKSEGHGFGLAVTYRVVRNHGGTIRALNGEDGGAVVQIELPIHGDWIRELAA